MNWLSRLFSPQREGGLRPAREVFSAPHASTLFPTPTSAPTSQASAYARSSWVYVAVSRIAESAALVPLKVFTLHGEQRLEAERHPLERLLERPNPLMSRFDLMEQTLGWLELAGNAYWFLSGDSSGRPTELWPLRPDRVSVVPADDGTVRGYLYTLEGAPVPLDAVEVIHFKRWNPLNDYYGLSALTAAQLTLETDQAMSAWNGNTFGLDHGVPAGIVTLPETTTEADFERIKREWRASYGGTQRRTAFLRGREITWQSIAQNHTDLDFLQGRLANRDEILNVFGIPIGLVSENATEANAKVAERTFIERTLYPKLVRIAAKITADLLPFFPGEAVAEFEDIRPTDVQARHSEIQAALPVMSINEIRAHFFSLPPVIWGDLPVGAPAMAATDQPPVAAINENPADEPAITAVDPAIKALEELRQWEAFTLRRWNQAARPFRVEHLPPEVALEISARLLTAETPAAAKHIFQTARADLLPVQH
ncbi:MAG: phage portal protein [Phototrophicaceae bacterium]